eukprot:CAMPEP_0184024442 /NCGR_PEP_ID=MMETSP0954-20121128/12086_1 /TAXON_ID=627963 /ORGANISM="Aplanochytrium sp, Strain PBS07" /LENGTH=320 /DNA_ID=CAMNT_0026307773 /DNA_START=9 /DNA_END=971 /DNA_ORIENTATION=-
MNSHNQQLPTAPPANQSEGVAGEAEDQNLKFKDPDPPSYINSGNPSPVYADNAPDDVYSLNNPLATKEYTLACLAVASLILLFASSVSCKNSSSSGGCSGEHAFAVAVAFVSLVVTIVYLVHVFKKSLHFLPERHALYFAAFFFFWWLIGLFVLTMSSPFAEPSNGYFSIWAAFLCSGSLLHREEENFRTALGYVLNIYDRSKPLAVVLFASFICVVAAIPPCSTSDCQGDEAFAIVLGVISALVCIGLFIMKENIGNFAGYLVGFLCMWWLIGVLVCTFQGPFAAASGAVISANGFFATWVGLFGSAWMLVSGKKGDLN